MKKVNDGLKGVWLQIVPRDTSKMGKNFRIHLHFLKENAGQNKA